ncbi:replication factor A protein [Trifolium repens]|nr:replication factor A protein [Trifolium repens]
MGKSATGLPIFVQFPKVKIFRDKTSIQNVINTTRILINPDILEVETLKNRKYLMFVDLDSDGSSNDTDAKDDFQSDEFVKDLIVSCNSLHLSWKSSNRSGCPF